MADLALVVEDGTGVEDANTFADETALRLYAQQRGKVLPADLQDLIVLAYKSMDFFAANESLFDGERLIEGQPLTFPRTGGYVNNVLIADGTIPPEVITLQAACMCELAAGVDLFPTATERALKRQKTGPLEKEWFDADTSPSVPILDALLVPLTGTSNRFALTVRRI